MKILLLNQPVYNRGDEAAHRSLIRTINNSIPNALITIVLENIKEGTKDLITIIYRNYWCDKEEKDKLNKIL